MTRGSAVRPAPAGRRPARSVPGVSRCRRRWADGHSDADVLSQAVAEALLGALALVTRPPLSRYRPALARRLEPGAPQGRARARRRARRAARQRGRHRAGAGSEAGAAPAGWSCPSDRGARRQPTRLSASPSSVSRPGRLGHLRQERRQLRSCASTVASTLTSRRTRAATSASAPWSTRLETPRQRGVGMGSGGRGHPAPARRAALGHGVPRARRHRVAVEPHSDGTVTPRARAGGRRPAGAGRKPKPTRVIAAPGGWGGSARAPPDRRCRDLHVAGEPGHARTRWPEPFDQHRVVGAGQPSRRALRALRAGSRCERPCGVCNRQSPARSMVASTNPFAHPLDGLGHGSAQIAAPSARAAAEHGVDQGARDERADGVVHQPRGTPCGAARGPERTESCRVARRDDR